jgi:multidrug resistance efflux pump
LLPVLLFGGAVVVTVWLWGRHFGLPLMAGEVQAVRVDAVAPVDGRLREVPNWVPVLFDTVEANQVVALLDSQAATTTLARMQSDLARLRVSLAGFVINTTVSGETAEQTRLREARNLALDIESLRLGIVEREGLIETDKAEVARLVERIKAAQELVAKGLDSGLTLRDLQMQRDVVQKRVEATQKALEEARVQKASCEKRLGTFSATEVAEAGQMLVPIREAVLAQEQLLQDVTGRIQLLDVRAPFTGTITAIHAWAGQNVRAGTPILTIAATQGQYIVGYVRQEQRVVPVVDMTVDVRVRSMPRRSSPSKIDKVGPQVEPIPAHHLRDPRVPEWGLPVRIVIPGDMALRPGELVDVVIKTGPASQAKQPRGAALSLRGAAKRGDPVASPAAAADGTGGSRPFSPR